jgi:hypothetical protein
MSLNPARSLDSGPLASVCRTYGDGSADSWYARSGAAGAEYSAVVDHAALPGSLETAEVRICRGAAVDLGDGWAFFDDLAPAAAFVRAGSMSNLMASWDLFEAAEVRTFCAEHRSEEAALLLGRQVYERSEMNGLVARFAAADTWLRLPAFRRDLARPRDDVAP